MFRYSSFNFFRSPRPHCVDLLEMNPSKVTVRPSSKSRLASNLTRTLGFIFGYCICRYSPRPVVNTSRASELGLSLSLTHNLELLHSSAAAKLPTPVLRSSLAAARSEQLASYKLLQEARSSYHKLLQLFYISVASALQVAEQQLEIWLRGALN